MNWSDANTMPEKPCLPACLSLPAAWPRRHTHAFITFPAPCYYYPDIQTSALYNIELGAVETV